MNQRNYQRELESIIQRHQNESRIPRLLLHGCCAPCSSYCLEYLSQYFEVVVYYYNPNISPEEEYQKRAAELGRLVACLPTRNPVRLSIGPYEPWRFYDMARGLEGLPEGGERCLGCYRLRLEAAARLAAEGGFDYFTTTLTISPLKNAKKLNEIGEEVGCICHVPFLPSDFKKKNGYKRSVELSAEYGLYRQDYCGCVFSKRNRDMLL